MSHTFLALHYWAGAGREFAALRALLPAHAELLAPDLPGFGQQPAPVGFDYSVGAYADWIAAYIQQCALTNFTLVGHSMGGKIALALAARRLVGLRRLVLLSPSPPTAEPMTAADRTAALAAFGKPEEAINTFRKITWQSLSGALRENTIVDNLRCTRPAWNAWLNKGSREDISALLPQLAVPCQLLVGAYDRAITPATQRRYTLPHLPPGTLCTVVPDAGHLLPLEVPAVVAALLQW